jgi:hypothetical protein
VLGCGLCVQEAERRFPGFCRDTTVLPVARCQLQQSRHDRSVEMNVKPASFR